MTEPTAGVSDLDAAGFDQLPGTEHEVDLVPGTDIPTVVQTPVEAVNHPAHYGGADNPYEAIKVIEALGYGEGFTKGNALKYLMRAGLKPGESEDQDLAKAEWFINRRREQLGG